MWMSVRQALISVWRDRSVWISMVDISVSTPTAARTPTSRSQRSEQFSIGLKANYNWIKIICWHFSVFNTPSPFSSCHFLSVQSLYMSDGEARVSWHALLHCASIHEHHLRTLRSLRHLPDPGHQRLSWSLQLLPHSFWRRKRWILHTG